MFGKKLDPDCMSKKEYNRKVVELEKDFNNFLKAEGLLERYRKSYKRVFGFFANIDRTDHYGTMKSDTFKYISASIPDSDKQLLALLCVESGFHPWKNADAVYKKTKETLGCPVLFHKVTYAPEIKHYDRLVESVEWYKRLLRKYCIENQGVTPAVRLFDVYISNDRYQVSCRKAGEKELKKLSGTRILTCYVRYNYGYNGLEFGLCGNMISVIPQATLRVTDAQTNEVLVDEKKGCSFRECFEETARNYSGVLVNQSDEDTVSFDDMMRLSQSNEKSMKRIMSFKAIPQTAEELPKELNIELTVDWCTYTETVIVKNPSSRYEAHWEMEDNDEGASFERIRVSMPDQMELRQQIACYPMTYDTIHTWNEEVEARYKWLTYMLQFAGDVWAETKDVPYGDKIPYEIDFQMESADLAEPSDDNSEWKNRCIKLAKDPYVLRVTTEETE